MVEMVEREGNTKPPATSKKSIAKKENNRISASKRWCFTHNNYSEDQLVEMVEDFKRLGMDYVVGREVGEQGTPHLQGYVRAEFVFRPMEKFKWSCKPHWEKCKGDHGSNVKYCSKDNNYVTNLRLPKPIVVQEPYGWQRDVADIVETEPDTRTIHWFWEPEGGRGKSSLVRWLAVKKHALVCSGKASDMKYLVVKYAEQHDGCSPDVIVFDVPRASKDYLSYTGIEEIKNGCFASTKYECGMHVMAHPHVFVFANFEPVPGQDMSRDRFHTVHVQRRIDELRAAEQLDRWSEFR